MECCNRLLNQRKLIGLQQKNSAQQYKNLQQQSPRRTPTRSQNQQSFLLLQYQGTNDSEWYCAVESALDTTFLIQKDPQSLTEYLIKQLSKFLFPKLQVELRTQDLQYPEKLEENEDNIGSKGSQQMNIEELGGGSQGQDFENKLAQLLFVVGHVALKFLLNIDDLDLRIKQIKNEVETRKDQHKSGQNEELDQIQGGWEAQFDVILEKLHSIPENYLLSFHNENKNLLSLFIPILKKLAIDILNNKRQANNDLLSRVVVLTMSKFMCVSSQFCKENMEFLFKFLDSKFVDPVIKTNILISLGDLIHRHPNIIEPYSFHLYKNLRDQNPSVRKTTLMVITHLILNDMLKLKGEISDIALLFSDPDPKIQNLVKLFFHELHKKDQKLIYNLLPESIGRLSGTDGSEHQLNISEEEFKEYARNIMQYLEKDKLSEILVEKLCQRLKNSQNKKEWRNTACCLAMISQNEKSVRKLLEMFECFREKLNDNVIMDYFKQIEIKAKKISKPEWKNLVDEFETKLNNFKTATAEDRRKPVSKSQQQAIRRKNKGKMEEEKTKGVIRKGIQQMSRSRPKQRHQANSSDSEVSNEIVIDSDEDVQVVGSQNNRQNKQKAEKRDQNAQPQRTLRNRKPLNMMEIEGDSDGGEEDDDYGDEDN
eukprot:TRINITY_DN3791_c0_g1_i15.p1 TRINITY_DN3791_c0_g1~~TRINITY_DN3791_c0_g1_i15.p1  ORF type:complete len:652 (-),score=84.98 TRINITY_DN3791_c0_g1_i15:83-2038(-)